MRTLLIGDVHGCLQELQELIERCQPQQGDTLIFIGDLIDKGPDSAGVLRYVHALSEKFSVKLILGNHEEKFLRYLDHAAHNPNALEEMSGIEEFPALAPLLKEGEIAMLKNAHYTLYLPENDILLLHGGIPGSCKLDLRQDLPWQGLDHKVKQQLQLLTMTRYLNAKGNFIELGKETPETPFWAETYDGKFGKVIFGHHPFLQEGPVQFPHAISIDNGCVFGGWLSTYILEKDGQTKTVSVKAKSAYAPLTREKAIPETTTKKAKEKVNTKSAGSSIMVIPAAIEDPQSRLPNVLQEFPLINDDFIDSSKHHPFVRDYLGKPGSNAFLQTYLLNKDKLSFTDPNGGQASFMSKFSAPSIHISSNQNTRMDFQFSSVAFCYNPQASLAYFVFVFQWKEPDLDRLLENLAASKFFRFVGEQDGKICIATKTKQKSTSAKPVNSQVNNPETIVEELDFKVFLSGIFPALEIKYKDRSQPNSTHANTKPVLKLLNSAKPVLLHLFHHPHGFDIATRHRWAYQVLRVAKRPDVPEPAEMTKENPDFISSILIDTSIGIYLLNEGAIIFDKNEDVKALIKKYLPTFLLTLNQRQFLIQMMGYIAGSALLPIQAMQETNRATREERIKAAAELQRLEDLRTRIIKMQLKQIFYSISHNDELNLFLLKLQERFRVSILLQDIKESIGELHQLLETNHEREQRRQEKRKEAAIKLVGFTISTFGFISTVDTILSNNQATPAQHNLGYLVVSLISLGLAGWFWGRNR